MFEVSKREMAFDVVKSVLLWIVVTVLAFGYWVGVLLIASLILLNVWIVTFKQIVRIAIVLTVLTSIAYLIRMLYKKFHSRE